MQAIDFSSRVKSDGEFPCGAIPARVIMRQFF